MDLCVICNCQLINKEQTLRARMRNKDGKPVADRIVYKAWCPNCEIYLRKSTLGHKAGFWVTSDVREFELICEIPNNEFLNIKTEIEKYIKTDKGRIRQEKWNEFISVKKENDYIYSYSQNDNLHTIKGYVIKRGIHFISQFISEINLNTE